MARDAFKKNPEVEAWFASDLPGKKLSASNFLSVGTRISPAGDQYGDLVSSGLRMMSPRFGL